VIAQQSGLPLVSTHIHHHRIPRYYVPEYDENGKIFRVKVENEWVDDEYTEDMWSLEYVDPEMFHLMAEGVKTFNSAPEGSDEQHDIGGGEDLEKLAQEARKKRAMRRHG